LLLKATIFFLNYTKPGFYRTLYRAKNPAEAGFFALLPVRRLVTDYVLNDAVYAISEGSEVHTGNHIANRNTAYFSNVEDTNYLPAQVGKGNNAFSQPLIAKLRVSLTGLGNTWKLTAAFTASAATAD
jgi:hypothetical protein